MHKVLENKEVEPSQDIKTNVEEGKSRDENEAAAAESKTSKFAAKKFGAIVGGLKKDHKPARRDSRSSTSSKSGGPDGKKLSISSSSAASSSSSVRKSANEAVKKSTNDLSKKAKVGAGLSAFKAKTGTIVGKKKKEVIAKEEIKTIKSRLFFIEREDPSDEDILKNIGIENFQKFISQGIDEIAHAATFMKKYIRKEQEKSMKDVEKVPAASFYIGAINARKGKTSKNSLFTNSAVDSTIFLGKTLTKKDRFGLFRGTEMLREQEEVPQDNPVISALERMKARLEQGEQHSEPGSRPGSRASRASRQSNAVDLIPITLSPRRASFVSSETVSGLNTNLAGVVRPEIREWNLHKHVKGDRKLKPILIPF